MLLHAGVGYGYVTQTPWPCYSSLLRSTFVVAFFFAPFKGMVGYLDSCHGHNGLQICMLLGDNHMLLSMARLGGPTCVLHSARYWVNESKIVTTLLLSLHLTGD